MRLELEILDGPDKGKKIPLKRGLILGSQSDSYRFNDKQMLGQHAVLTYDQKNTWNIECLDGSKLRLGSVEQARAALLPGLIFHLGQTGFKVIHKELPRGMSWKEALKDWLNKNPGQNIETTMFFFLHPIRLNFVQGPQFGDFFTLSYGPRELGYNSLDIALKDPSSPLMAVRFLQIGDTIFIENFCANLALINGQHFNQHVIHDGDLLTVGTSVIELSFVS